MKKICNLLWDLVQVPSDTQGFKQEIWRKIQILIGRNQYTSEVLPWQATEIQKDRIVSQTIMFQGLCQTSNVYLYDSGKEKQDFCSTRKATQVPDVFNKHVIETFH